jgi:starvation-inducible outer membrane lipoprotein
LKDVDPNFDFSRWRMFPNSAENHKIQLGGRIVQSHGKDQTLTIVAAQLPIVDHPAYGPKDTAKSSSRLFAILYQGKLDPPFLHTGNRLIVVGYTLPPIRVEVEDVLRSLPAMTGQCIHIWQTGNSDIADFHSGGAGHVVLKEDTYCGGEMPWSPIGNF